MRTGAIRFALLAIGASALAEDVIQLKSNLPGKAGEKIVCTVVQVAPDRVVYTDAEGTVSNVLAMTKVMNIVFDVLIPDVGQAQPGAAQVGQPPAPAVVVMSVVDAEKVIKTAKTLRGKATSVLDKDKAEPAKINDNDLATCYYFKGGSGAVDIKCSSSVTARGLVLISHGPQAPNTYSRTMKQGRLVVNETETYTIPEFPPSSACVLTMPKAVLVKSVRVESIGGFDPGIKEIMYFK
jgi:hypothetical protein